MKFTKDFRGVPNGELYPVNYRAGDECPSELEAAAIELGAVKVQAKQTPEPVAAEAPKPAGKTKGQKAPAEPVAAEVPANANPDD